MDRGPALDPVGRNEPLAAVGHEHEQVIETIQVERLDETAPAAVSTPCAHRYRPALLVTERRGLHLDACEAAIEIGDQIVMRAVAERNRDMRTLGHEPV